MASTKLTRTFSSTGNRKIFTTSFWMKRSKLGGQQPLFSTDLDNTNNNYTMFYLDGGDGIGFFNTDGGVSNVDYLTNRKLRDTNSWYHIVIVFDSTQSGGNRIKFYINGVRETSFANSTEPNQDADNTWFNRTYEHMIGTRSYDSSTYFDGSMSHFHFIDGTAYDASYFGSTDSTTGEWKINTGPSVTYGTNGFFILKDGNTITDSSPNSNHFSLGGGTLTKTEDNPSNVFATGNILNVNSGAVGTFSNGNNTIKVANSTGSVFGSSSTLGMTTGKFYCEAKIITRDSTMIGVSPSPSEDARNNKSPSGANGSLAVGCLAESGNKYISDNGTTYGAATAEGGIMMIALDLDNLKVYFGSGGQWSNGSGAWNQSGLTSGAAISITAVASTAEGAYFFGFGDGGGSAKGKVAWNFGNGYFETTAVSSAGSNASNNGIFEYDVPTGYTALSTKGLNL